MAKTVPTEVINHLAPVPVYSKYDWDKWSDGRWWQLDKGEDYYAQPASVKASAYKWGKANSFKVQVRVAEDETHIFVKFTPK